MDGSASKTDSERIFSVVGFAGSLRRGSYNRALLRASAELAPPTLHIAIHELDEIRLYNGVSKPSPHQQLSFSFVTRSGEAMVCSSLVPSTTTAFQAY